MVEKATMSAVMDNVYAHYLYQVDMNWPEEKKSSSVLYINSVKEDDGREKLITYYHLCFCIEDHSTTATCLKK
jgi:hypothetical protein